MTCYISYKTGLSIRFPQEKIYGPLDNPYRNLVPIRPQFSPWLRPYSLSSSSLFLLVEALYQPAPYKNTLREGRKIGYAFAVHPQACVVSKSSPIRSELFDLQRLSEYSSVSKGTLRTWIRRPENPLPAIQVGNKLLVRRDVFDSWLERHAVKPHSDVAGIVGEIFRGVR